MEWGKGPDRKFLEPIPGQLSACSLVVWAQKGSQLQWQRKTRDNIQLMFLSIFFVPGPVLTTLYIWSHWILSTVLWCWWHHYFTLHGRELEGKLVSAVDTEFFRTLLRICHCLVPTTGVFGYGTRTQDFQLLEEKQCGKRRGLQTILCGALRDGGTPADMVPERERTCVSFPCLSPPRTFSRYWFTSFTHRASLSICFGFKGESTDLKNQQRDQEAMA